MTNTSVWILIWRSAKRKRYIYVCLFVSVAIAMIQPALVGKVYGESEAIRLLEGLQASSLYFGSAIATASATVLALMLTLLSMTHQLDAQFDRSVYQGIRLVGFISTVTFIISVLLLLCLSMPVGEFDQIPIDWFKALYYTISALNGLLSGLMIIGILILFDTVNLLIKKIAPE